MSIKPLADRILIKAFDEEEAIQGGIIIPDTAKEKPQKGEVISVGPGKYDDAGKLLPMSVKKGQRVLVGKYAGTEIKIDEVEHVIVREDEILGIIE